ncbi:MAG: CHAD domain-containing protein [Thaumarchaeota archaeon]|nr:CHAD domain-containing protein [Nitrososphaerota archaeon]
MKRSESFSKNFAKLIRNLDSNLEILLQKPNSKSIHDVRTSIRRVEAASDLLPKKTRSKHRFRRYNSACKRVFKSTTPIRDIDVVISKLGDYESKENVSSALSKLRSDRDQMISSTLQNAKLLLKIKTPRTRGNKVSESRVGKGKRKALEKVQMELDEVVPVILTDFRKMRELHDLRKDCKIARYTLEILPVKEERGVAKLMQEWQRILGNIRDIDISEHFVEESELGDDLTELLKNLNLERAQLLETFTRSAGTYTIRSLNFAPAANLRSKLDLKMTNEV